MSARRAKYRYRRLACDSPANASFRFSKLLDPFKLRPMPAPPCKCLMRNFLPDLLLCLTLALSALSAVASKFDSVRLKEIPIGFPRRDLQLIQCVIVEILDFMAAQAHQVVMPVHIGIKPRRAVLNRHISNQSGLPQGGDGIVDGVERQHREPRLHGLINLLHGRMRIGVDHHFINSIPLRGHLESLFPESSPDSLRCTFGALHAPSKKSANKVYTYTI